LKHKKEEEEQLEASKKRKMVAESSAMLTATLGNTLSKLIAVRSNMKTLMLSFLSLRKISSKSWMLERSKQSKRFQISSMKNSMT
jgi:hypothetical protein